MKIEGIDYFIAIYETGENRFPEYIAHFSDFYALNDFIRNADSVKYKNRELSYSFVENIDGNARGYYSSYDQIIVVQAQMSNQQTIKTCVHEITHALLHGGNKEQNHIQDRYTKEVEAESVAYIVCQHFGIDTSEYSFGYIAGWSRGRQMEELKGSLNTIRSTSADMINAIEIILARNHVEVEAEENSIPNDVQYKKQNISRCYKSKKIRC